MIITPKELHSQKDDFTVIDVRPKDQRDAFPLLGLDSVVSENGLIPHMDVKNVLVCQFGIVTEEMILEQDLDNTYSLLGGVQAWNEYQRKAVDLSRYSRQIALPEIGVSGQKKLQKATVSIVGIGGLGCPAAQSLVSTGVGRIQLIDGDMIELSNIHRQPLFDENSIGQNKAEVAAKKLTGLNNESSVIPIPENLVEKNSTQLLSGSDVVIDATDSLAARRIIDQATHHLNIPMVFGALYRYEGQVAVFKSMDGPRYGDIFPNGSSGGETCNDAGVLGMLPGIIGHIQALETVKLITGIEPTLAGKMLVYDGMNHSMDTIEL